MERRDDIGGKLIITIAGGIIMLLMTLFVNSAWSIANEGRITANAVALKETALEAHFDSFEADLIEIKDLLKRKLP